MRRHQNQTAIVGLGGMRAGPADGPRGDRRRGGVSPVQASVWNVGTCRVMPRENSGRGGPTKEESTDARARGGRARTSGEPW